jgi:steroid delta-isomerase-like uncharacterized protein
MSDHHITMMQRLYEEIFNAGNLDVADELIAPDAVDHQGLPDSPPGPDGLKQLAWMYRSAFPDLSITVEDIIASDDKVVARTTMRGTHEGELMGIPPTGRAVEVSGIDIVRFVDGRMVEHWGNQDNMGMMRQLGLIE